MLRWFVKVFLVGSISGLWAQEAHFSQHQAVPLYSNPAMTGMFNGLWRLSGVWRYQWPQLVPYHTWAVGIDFHLRHVGLGAWFYNDIMGDVNFGVRHAQLSLSYMFIPRLNEHIALSAGVAFAYTWIGLDPDKVILPDQWTQDRGFDNIPNELLYNQQGFFRLHTGITLATRLGSNVYGLLGFSINNAVAQNVTLIQNNDKRYRFPIRYGFHAYLQIPTWKGKWTLLPSLWSWYQHPHFQMVVGSFFRKTIIRDFRFGVRRMPVHLDFGLFYRVRANLFPAIRIVIGRLHLGFSFDVTTSPLSPTTNFIGGPEFSIQLLEGKGLGHARLPCPDM